MCAANVSEGRDIVVLNALREAAGAVLADAHVDPDHHRSVLTMIGAPEDLVVRVAAVAGVALRTIDLQAHVGVHPRRGAIDVVPFAPLVGRSLELAVRAREAAIVAISDLGIPTFRYGPHDGPVRSLPEIRRRAFFDLAPDAGPPVAHATAGATAVGARAPLVAWNVWLEGASIDATQQIATAVRSEHVRALGLAVGGDTQVSCNLVEPAIVTPLDVYTKVEASLPPGAQIVRCELVGLVPEAVLAAVPESWWPLLDLARAFSVERAAARLGFALPD